MDSNLDLLDNIKPHESLKLYNDFLTIKPHCLDPQIKSTTNINIIQTSLFDIHDKAAITIIGMQQQYSVYKGFSFLNLAKEVHINFHHSLYTKNNSSQLFRKRCINDTIWVIEPEINTNLFNQSYTTHRDYGTEIPYILHTYLNEVAFKEASQDLPVCYQHALVKSEEILKKNQKIISCKHITLPILSIDRGFSKEKAIAITLTSILDYLKEKPNTYDDITIFIENECDFKLCKDQVIKNCIPIKYISFFLWLYKNEITSFSKLPRELIDYIAEFILNS